MPEFGPSNPSFEAFFTISSHLSMRRPKSGKEWAPLLDPHVAQKVVQETSIHFQLAHNIVIQSCYNCSIVWHFDLYHFLSKPLSFVWCQMHS